MVMAEGSAATVAAEFADHQDMDDVDMDFFEALLTGVSGNRSALDDVFSPALDRAITELDPIEHCILRLGTFELCHRIDVPARVVINEGVELAKTFGASESHRYINSILDKLAREHRSVEMDSARAR